MVAAAPPDWRPLYPFESHRLELPSGHGLHYLDEGPRDAPPLLAVHGNPTWSFYWRELVKRFRGRHRVVAPDHLGCGLSDKPRDGPYRLRDHIHNLERLLLELDLADVTLCLHDWGGAIGMGVAARHPERIARLVILNTAAFPSRAIPIRIAVCRIPGLGPLMVRGLNAFARAATFMATERGLSPEVKAGYLAPYGSWAERVAIQRFVEDIPLDASHPSWPALVEVEEGLARFAEHPALIAWGERDWCFTPAFRCEWQRRLPRAEVMEIEDAGHYVMEDATGPVLDRIARFLASSRCPD